FGDRIELQDPRNQLKGLPTDAGISEIRSSPDDISGLKKLQDDLRKKRLGKEEESLQTATPLLENVAAEQKMKTGHEKPSGENQEILEKLEERIERVKKVDKPGAAPSQNEPELLKHSSNSVRELRSVPDSEDIVPILLRKFEEFADDNAQLKFDNAQFKLDIAQLKRENANLKQDNENLKSHQQEKDNDLKLREHTVEERLRYLEAITRQITPRTCQTLADLGVTLSGTYLVDPDGVFIGDPPIQVLCDMGTDPVSTIVLHDSMENTEIDHCPDPGSYSRSITYDASLKQIKALIDQSESCEQQITYNCFTIALTTNDVHYAWWMDRHDEPQYYWDGSHAGEHVCNCGLTGDCIDPIVPCNCDAEAPQWESDVGAITNGTALPITELRFGGFRMDLEETDPEFQVETSARLSGEVVYFNAYGTSGSEDSVLHFDGTEVN
ncbi:unnamed protein product, partial [Darwinula stevensoni]